MRKPTLTARMYQVCNRTGTGDSGIQSSKRPDISKPAPFMKRSENTIYELWGLKWRYWQYIPGTVFYMTFHWGLTRESTPKSLPANGNLAFSAQDHIFDEWLTDTDQFAGYDTPTFDAGNNPNYITFPEDVRPILLDMPVISARLYVFTDGTPSRLFSIQIYVDLYYTVQQVDDKEYNRWCLLYDKR